MEEEEEEVGELFNEIVKLPPTITLERERERCSLARRHRKGCV